MDNPVISWIKASRGARSDIEFLSLIKDAIAKDPSLLEKTDKDNATPLHWAVFRGPYELVKLLADMGANKKAMTRGKLTPYDLAKVRAAPPAIMDAVAVRE